ncbi:DUF2993 domain-containing protein [Nocardia sp. NPDC005978]|uniref:LmeA family phospholipid-binding protein n=1 Tax=Nocardia sp. NPDC005978 TaxID=3156725 RepID=UPI0033A49F65
MRKLLIMIVLLTIGFGIADRVSVAMAQNEIGRKIHTEYDLPKQPGVQITGFPFLTQAADGRYGEVDIRVGDWTEQNVTVHDLAVRLTNVSAPLLDLISNQSSSFVAGTATARAIVPYDTVRQYAPEGVETISDSPEGLRVTGVFSVEGIPVPATVFVTVAPVPDGIEITPVSVQPAAGGPAIPLALISAPLTFTVPLEKLPFGAQLTGIEPRADGLHLTAEAHEIRFNAL